MVTSLATFTQRLVATASPELGYWNIAPQRYCPRLARCWCTLPVSVDRAGKRSRAHPRGKPRFLTAKIKSRERQTLCWRKTDSNPRSLSRNSHGGLRVRILPCLAEQSVSPLNSPATGGSRRTFAWRWQLLCGSNVAGGAKTGHSFAGEIAGQAEGPPAARRALRA